MTTIYMENMYLKEDYHDITIRKVVDYVYQSQHLHNLNLSDKLALLEDNSIDIVVGLAPFHVDEGLLTLCKQLKIVNYVYYPIEDGYYLSDYDIDVLNVSIELDKESVMIILFGSGKSSYFICRLLNNVLKMPSVLNDPTKIIL